MIQGFTRNRRSRYRTAKCEGSSRESLSRDTGGRLNRSSVEMCESTGSKGFSLFKFHKFNKPEKR